MEDRMHAIVLRAPKEYGVEMVPIPVPGYKEVLVKIKAVAICGSDPKIFGGDYCSISWPPAFPFTPGHEFSGEIAALGDGVTEFVVGERVAGEAHKGCDSCENCRNGLYNLCLNYGKSETGHRHYGFTHQGAYADYNVYHVKALTKIPNNVSYEEAALTDTAGTSLQAIRMTGIVPGGYSFIIGPGPIGIFVMQIAKAMGSRTIMVGRKERLKLAGRLGADYLIDYEACGDIVEKVKEITEGAGAHQAFDCAGSDGAMGQCIRSVRKNGKVAFVALPALDEHLIPIKTMVMNQIHLYGSRANPNCSKDVLEFMSMGAIHPKEMITHIFPLQELEKAMDIFIGKKDGAMKVVVRPN